MTEYQKQQISWLTYESSRLGITEEELRKVMSKRGEAGGRARKGKPLTEAHKQKISEGRRAKSQEITRNPAQGG